MTRVYHVIRRGLLLASMLSGLTLTAHAQSVILSLNNVTFADGGTASGNISLNPYGYVLSADVVTTPGSSLLPGWDYPVPGAVAPFYLSGQQALQLYMGGTNIVLELDVAQAFSATMSGVDQITGGFEECSYGCPGGIPSGTIRNIVLTDSPDLLVPEPASLAILGGGFLGIAGSRQRRRTCSTVR